VQIGAEIKDAAPGVDVFVDLPEQHLDGVVDERAQLLHSSHAVWNIGDALLRGMHVLSRLGEDIRVLGRGEYAVEGRLEEALSSTQQCPRRLG